MFTSGVVFILVLQGSFLQFGEVKAQVTELRKEFIHPTPLGYSQAVAVISGDSKTVYVSGQTGEERDGEAVEALAQQADAAFQSLVSELDAAGVQPSDVVMLNVYIKDLDLAKATVVGAAKAKHFTGSDHPATTWIGVTSLLTPEILVEIDAVAVVGS